MPPRPLYFSLVLGFCLITFCGGCSSEVAYEKKNLFDEEHFVPDHWPKNVKDLATGFEARTAVIRSSKTETAHDLLSVTRNELKDLISWAPEITADSPLPEAQWIPIYELTEQLNRRLQTEGDNWSEGSFNLIQELGQHIRSAASQLETVNDLPAVSPTPESSLDEEFR